MPRKKSVERREARERNPEALGIAGFTLGIVSLVLFIVYTPAGIVASLVGLILCLFQQKKKRTRTATIGVILNIIGLVVNIVLLVISIIWLAPYASQISQQATVP